jgi:hypothetical protein
MGLLTEHETKVLRYVISVLERDIVDVQAEVTEQPRLLASIGYFHKYMQRQTKDLEEALEKIWLQKYAALHTTKYSSTKTSSIAKAADMVGKFTDKLVSAQVLQDPQYASLTERAGRVKYITDQLSELREAFKSRTSFLIQFSSNARYDRRNDLQEE